MAKLSAKNVKQASSPWMVNTTGFLTGLVAALTTMVSTMPATVSPAVRDWLEWGVTAISVLAALFAGATMLSKKADSTDPKDPLPPKP